MRYRAYLNKIDISTWTPGNKVEDIDINSPIDEDEDLHILQHRIREKGIETVKRTRIIDTLYEERFNKKQEEIQSNLSEVVKSQLQIVLKKYSGQLINDSIVDKIKNDIAPVLSNALGAKIHINEIYIKETNNTYILSLPAYNIYNIDFTL